ncbi:MAG: acyltransferase [Lachnospiraceae bacterium]|nr:acyltransferase [Lachnospiraceae bacterium]
MEVKAVQNNRIGWLDAWKGFATLLVVLGHIADGYLDAGMFPGYTGVLQTGYDIIYSFHMPLFFVLSGYAFYVAYAKNREVKKRSMWLQIGNIAVVYILFSVLQWCFKMVFAGQVNTTYTWKHLWMIPVRTMAPYWYLYVLVLLYMVTWFIERVKQPEWLKVFFFLGLYFLSDLLPDSILFEIKRTLYYSFFFYFGIYLAKAVAPVLAEKLEPLIKHYRKIPKPGVLRWIGTYSLEIYVTHCFITAANRRILPAIGITNFYCNIVTNFIMAVLLPVAAACILKHLRLHSWIFRPVTSLTKHTSVR